MLLVDAESPVKDPPHLHLRMQDHWATPLQANRYHLMVQTMEAWLIADIESLKTYYGQGFHESAIPKNPNVEQIDKKQIETALIQASQHTQKGRYNKIWHGAALLKMINPIVVRSKAEHCSRLFSTIHIEIDSMKNKISNI
ncbi:MAG: DUF4276 family protein [Candidatus Omnitrophota bacterium]|nr:MAG: DUF4276 family protein [Candidatus Omnitrophota bacterium]